MLIQNFLWEYISSPPRKCSTAAEGRTDVCVCSDCKLIISECSSAGRHLCSRHLLLFAASRAKRLFVGVGNAKNDETKTTPIEQRRAAAYLHKSKRREGLLWQFGGGDGIVRLRNEQPETVAGLFRTAY